MISPYSSVSPGQFLGHFIRRRRARPNPVTGRSFPSRSMASESTFSIRNSRGSRRKSGKSGVRSAQGRWTSQPKVPEEISSEVGAVQSVAGLGNLRASLPIRAMRFPAAPP